MTAQNTLSICYVDLTDSNTSKNGIMLTIPTNIVLPGSAAVFAVSFILNPWNPSWVGLSFSTSS